jgi:hypothetical protein
MLEAVMSPQLDVDLATLKAEFAAHRERYDRDHEAAALDRAAIKTDLGELKTLLHQVKGGQKLAKWVAGAVLVPTFTLFGFPKVAALLAALGK